MYTRNPLLLALMALILGLVSPAFAEESPTTGGYSMEQLGTIAETQSCLRGGAKLRQIGAITDPQLTDGAKRCLEELNATLGTNLSHEDVLKIPTGNMPKLTALQRAAGYVTVLNAFWFFAVLGIGACLCIIFWQLGILFLMIPKEIYELLCYVGGGILIYRGAEPPIMEMEALLGSLLIFSGLILSKVRMKNRFSHATVIIPTIMSAVFSLAAVLTYSSVIGYFSVMSILAALGFSVVVLPGIYMLGYNDDDAVARGTTASFILLMVFAVLQMMGKTIPYLTLFADGVWLVAGIIGFLGLLIMSNRWFWKFSTKEGRSAERQKLGYISFQVIMVAACVAGLAFGSFFHINAIQKIAGTFLVLWAMEKPFEIAVESIIYYAFSGLCAFGSLYWLCTAGAMRPELFQMMLPF